MDMTNLLAQCHVYTADISTHDVLPPDQPAVYGFYDLLHFDHSTLLDQIDSFKTRHGRKLRMIEDDLPDFVRLSFRGNPDSFKGEGKKLCKDLTQPQAEAVAKSLAFLSFLNEPLYIGKTESIRERFYAHHDSGFLYTMKERYKRPASEFLLFTYFCDAQYVRLLESVLIQLINPPFCDQKT
jgi:hypothetical protein